MTITTEVWLKNRLENLALLARLAWRSDSATMTELRSTLANIELLAANAVAIIASEEKQ